MLAGGTGVAPMLQIIRAVLHNAYPDVQLSLVYAAEYEHEFSLVEALQMLVNLHPTTFKYYLTVAHPPQGWIQGVGFIDATIIKQRISPASNDSLVVICGPPRMCDAIKGTLKRLGFSEDMFYSY
jgi:cytochrome-b5 reductase